MFPVELIAPLPQQGDPGAFRAHRKHDIHTGVDLYAEHGAIVRCLEDGVITNIEDFTGPKAGSPWWHDTKSVLVENDRGVILYGEITPLDSVAIGQTVKQGEVLGHVSQVLRKDKGVTPTSMLHLECYDKGVRQSVVWGLNEEMPQGLRDPEHLLNTVWLSNEYLLMTKFYGSDRAKRSQVPLVNHIQEGIEILQYLGASLDAQKAFALHPLLQGDEALGAQFNELCTNKSISTRALGLALEYRNVANQYLSHRSIASIDEIALSPLEEVNDMLRADKIQNYKDFLLYHKDSHARTKELDQYFKFWLERLGMTERFSALARQIGKHSERGFEPNWDNIPNVNRAPKM